ncbi:purine-binding protein precursor [Oxobacter pfennigii]|uniref:Purine-binding protein n=1 Tax=Oxobacter pfennigii TaxID=36849 RepID=A0A0P9AEA4_9CLOT|nr:BMP family ABC transporter substrate-binding protein [Oxobacter pfennigii]KPU43635.1 purine-binding protein precursor [Oxobacter pfennigii]
MKKITGIVLSLVLLLSVLLTGCGGSQQGGTPTATPTPTEQAAEPLVVGFIYIGPVNDGGWTEAHNNGRLEMETALGDKVKTLIMENVPESADVEKAMRDMIDQGAKVIFATSFGYQDYVAKVAKEFPDVTFLHCSGSIDLPNVGTYFGKMYEARYLSGIVAGMKTETNKIGYVAAMPIPEVIRMINAFTLGVQSVNKDATVEVTWTNTWYDPAKEKEAAKALLDKGCDVLAQHQDSTATQIAASEAGKFSIGYDLDHPEKVSGYMTAPIWHWGSYYIKTINEVLGGTWKPGSYWGPMSDGIVELAPLTSYAPEGAQAKIDEAKKAINDSSLKIFKGPLKDNTGIERVKEGQVMTDDEVWSMDWFVEGVIGKTN